MIIIDLIFMAFSIVGSTPPHLILAAAAIINELYGKDVDTDDPSSADTVEIDHLLVPGALSLSER
jgi:hypothetical protein